jgi:predicted dehydrogenase
MAKKKIRIAFIGCGGIHNAHWMGLQEIPDKAEVVACCDSNKASAEASAAKAPNGAAVYTDWKKMMAEVDCDAVDICLPHHLHKDAIIDSAKAKRHILCEKPLCLNMKEAKEIVAAVKKSGITYMSAHNQIFDPIVREAKKMLDAGAIGDVYYLRTQDCFVLPWLVEKDLKSLNWRGDVKKQGGGELIDTGYHPSYLLLYLAASPIAEVNAVRGNFTGVLKAEDTALVNVRFKNGSIGQIMTSWAMPNPSGGHQIHAIGSKGQIFGSHNDLYHLPHGFQEPSHKHLEGKGGIIAEMEHFVDCLLNKKKPVTSLQQGVDVLELILKATGRA